ncbi:MAG TPA: hypothetical protein VNO19_06705 [Gemmatimonadales bacterium]|nr:hypothetical protein [Gemmatimonadales bacterium]
MLRMWMVGCFLLPLACSDGDVRSAALSADTDSLGLADETQPMVMFRCESGRLGAYLVAGSAADDSDFLPDDAVRVDLDSAPPCIASAP